MVRFLWIGCMPSLSANMAALHSIVAPAGEHSSSPVERTVFGCRADVSLPQVAIGAVNVPPFLALLASVPG